MMTTTADPTPAPAPSPPPGAATFAYQAQTYDGQPISGTIDASDLHDAARRLETLRLRVIRLDKTHAAGPRARALSEQDFTTFNQQLAQLTAAGMPIERGLRLVAEDMRSGRLAQAVRQVADELDRGASLPDAFERHRRLFPPLYSTLIAAGVRSGNLSGMLLNLGRHIELVQRLRAALWRAAAYPLAVLAATFLVLIFLGRFVIPQFKQLYNPFHTELPGLTRFLFWLSDWTPVILIAAVVVFLGFPLLWGLLKLMRVDQTVADVVLVPMPLVGPVLKRNLIARWCDALRIAVEGNVDLPAAVVLAADVVGSPRLKRDGRRIADQLSAGRPIDELRRFSILPLTAVAVVQMAADRNDLPASLATLSTMYQQQGETRLAALQASLGPLLILLVAAMIAVIILGLFSPVFHLFRLF